MVSGTGVALCAGMECRSAQPLWRGRCLERAFKEMSGLPTSRSDVRRGRTTGSPTGREPQGAAEPTVVVGVTPHRGARESRVQGEVAQVTWTTRTKRYAKCRTPKRCWVSYVSAAGVACRYNGCIDNCSTRSAILWLTSGCTP